MILSDDDIKDFNMNTVKEDDDNDNDNDDDDDDTPDNKKTVLKITTIVVSYFSNFLFLVDLYLDNDDDGNGDEESR